MVNLWRGAKPGSSGAALFAQEGAVKGENAYLDLDTSIYCYGGEAFDRAETRFDIKGNGDELPTPICHRSRH